MIGRENAQGEVKWTPRLGWLAYDTEEEADLASVVFSQSLIVEGEI